MAPMKLHGPSGSFRVQKALIAAEFSGRKVENSKEFAFGKTNKEKKFLDRFPLGKVPSLEVGQDSIFESNAVAYYLANDQLRGCDDLQKSQIVQWMSFADSHLQEPMASWVFPMLGILEVSQSILDSAKANLKRLLGVLNDHLLTKTWLVGERLTLADIVVACTLLPAYQVVLEPNTRKPFANVNRWFTTFINQPQVKKVLGVIKLNEKEGTSTAVSASSGGDKKEKKEKKEAEPKPKADPKADDLDEEDEIKEKLTKDPFLKFPEGNFDFNDFKRFYSNNDENKAIAYFWEKFDKENYSIWYGEYKYPEDLGLVFMSCNLMSGMMQRLDKMRKNAFGSLILFGEDHKGSIGQLWIWKGHELAFELCDDWMVDYESYAWRKLDVNSEECKTMVKEYFTWEGDFGGRKFNQGKIFK